MKTKILITGQISSKRTLKDAIQTLNCEVKTTPNGFILTFETKKEAVKSLSDAYQYLKADKEDWENSCGSYMRAAALNYDAAKAIIIDDDVQQYFRDLRRNIASPYKQTD